MSPCSLACFWPRGLLERTRQDSTESSAFSLRCCGLDAPFKCRHGDHAAQAASTEFSVEVVVVPASEALD